MGARGETNDIEKMKLRIEYDIAYNNNWNLIEDFLILFKTFLVFLKAMVINNNQSSKIFINE